jgi:hypothetical protein
LTKLDVAIALCGIYEAELLVDLMLRYWQHPLATDDEFANFLVETAAEILERAKKGERFFEEFPPEEMNFVAAVWYAETCQLSDSNEAQTEKRREWLAKVRHSLPACFCDPTDLI